LLLHSESDPITSFAASEQFYSNSNKILTFLRYKEQFHELHNEPIKAEVLGKIAEWINVQVSKSNSEQ
jgi:alpha-beta hydrolase superfamily lysophospholipase